MVRCHGCSAKADAEGVIPEKDRKGIRFFFRRWRKGDEL